MKIKVSLFEWLCELNIIKKARFPRYSTEFVLNSKDLEEVFNFVSKNGTKGVGLGYKIEADYDGMSYFRAYVPAGYNKNGDELVKTEVRYDFDETDDGYISVELNCADAVQNNARFWASNIVKKLSKIGFIE